MIPLPQNITMPQNIMDVEYPWYSSTTPQNLIAPQNIMQQALYIVGYG